MLNQAVIVGRIKEFKENDLLIEVNRTYKNENGEYDTDLLKVKMGFDNPNINEYITNGSLIGVKGRIENINNQNIIVAEKITFLSGKNETE